MILLDWRLTVLSLGLLPFFIYLTFRVGKVRRAVSTETQQTLAEMSAATEETLSVSGILLTKTFGQQESANLRFGTINARLAGLQIRQAMVGRWFFMIIGTIFSITPAFVYWPGGLPRGAGRSFGTDRGDDRRVHHAPEPAVLPDGPAAERPGRDPGHRSRCSTGSSSTSTWSLRSATDPTQWRSIRTRVAGRVAFRDVSFRYPATPVLAAAGADGRAGADGTDGGADAGSVAEERAAVIGEVIAETEPSAEPVDVAVADLEARPDAIDERSIGTAGHPDRIGRSPRGATPGLRTRRASTSRSSRGSWWLSSARRAPARRPRPT